MRKLLLMSLLICGFFSFSMTNAFASTSNEMDPTTTVRLTAVNNATGEITMTNLGNTTFDISGFWLCDQPAYTALSSLTPTAGDYNLDMGESVTVVWGTLTGSADGEVALYNTNSFGASSAVEDYFQYGNDPHGRTDEAVAAGVWVSGEFVAGTGAFTFSGGLTDFGASMWALNGCTDSAAANYNIDATADDGSCLYDHTFNVDMNCETGFSNVNVTGPVVGWCADCLPLADGDGDGIWSATFQLPLGAFEYKYNVDAFAGQEDLVDDMVNGGTCAPITDFATYANRTTTVDGTGVENDAYGTCGVCDPGAGCTDPLATNYDAGASSDDGSCLFNITFNVDMNCETGFTNVNVTGPAVTWCANCLPLSDGDGDGIWSGTFVLPEGDYEYKYNVNDFAGQEDLIDDMNNGASCAPITDFATYANRQIYMDGTTVINDTYGSCDPCVPGGPGCTDPVAANYDSLASPDDGSCVYNVEFTVDMNCMPMGYTTVGVNSNATGWCPTCLPLTDQGGGIWSGTHAFPVGVIEFVYNVDGPPGQEDLIDDMVAGGTCAPVTDFASYANRTIDVLAVALNTTSGVYGQCDACVPGVFGCTDSDATNYDPAATDDDGSCMYDITFSVDMNCETGFSNVNVTGPVVGWCGSCLPLSDVDGDGIWTGTFSLQAGNFEYKYNVDDFAGQEDLVDDMVGGASCAPVTDFATYANRLVAIDGSTMINDTYGTCGVCVIPGCTYAEADNYNPMANDDDGSCTFPTVANCPGDADGNNVVNILDLVAVSSNFGSECLD